VPFQRGHRYLPKRGAIYTLDQPVFILLSTTMHSLTSDAGAQAGMVLAAVSQELVPSLTAAEDQASVFALIVG